MRLAKRLTTWLKVHPKIFSLLGTFIVLVTFTIKEAWRDSVKDKLDDFNNGVDQFNIEQSIEETQRNVVVDTKAVSIRSEDKQSLFGDYQRLSAALSVDSKRGLGLKTMCKKLKCDAAGVSASSRSESVALDSFTKFIVQFRAEPTFGTLSDVTRELRDAAFFDEMKFSLTLDASKEDLLETVEKHRQDEERLLGKLTVVSISFYFLGALIGVIGTLADIEPKKVGG
jgi:hypothetical protein